MKYRVLMLGASPDDHGGISRVIAGILSHWPDCKYKIDLLVTHADGSGFHKLVVFFKSIPSFIFRIAWRKIDLLHVHFSVNASIFRKSFFVLIAKIAGVKILLHSHTGELEIFLQKFPPLIQNYIKWILNLADGIIILGKKDIEIYGKYNSHSVLRFLRNAVDRQRIQSDLEGQQIIIVGSLGQRKGTYDLLKVIPSVIRVFPEVSFLLVGDGDVKKIENMLEKSAFRNNTTVTGWLPHNKVHELYRSSCIFLLPSYYEGMPMAILEAMSMGLPVISTDVNGIPDVVLDGETGILTQPGKIIDLSEAIIKLLSDPTLRKNMGRKGQQRVESLFSFEAVTKDLIAIYDDVIFGGNHGAT
jgi:glycosyltransferase involved in cell wall biosynthesis